MDADKIAKIRTLAENGATEGERSAARAALERMGIPPQAQEQIVMEMNKRVRDTGGVFAEDLIQDIMDMYGFGAVQSTAPHHHGRVWFDRN